MTEALSPSISDDEPLFVDDESPPASDDTPTPEPELEARRLAMLRKMQDDNATDAEMLSYLEGTGLDAQTVQALLDRVVYADDGEQPLVQTTATPPPDEPRTPTDETGSADARSSADGGDPPSTEPQSTPTLTREQRLAELDARDAKLDAETDADRLRRGAPGQSGELAHEPVTDDVTNEDLAEHQYQAEGDQQQEQQLAQTAQTEQTTPVRRELKLVVTLQPRDEGQYLARLAVGAEGCDPELCAYSVGDVEEALLRLLETIGRAEERWQAQPRYPAAPKTMTPPTRPSAAAATTTVTATTPPRRTPAARQPAAAATPAEKPKPKRPADAPRPAAAAPAKPPRQHPEPAPAATSQPSLFD